MISLDNDRNEQLLLQLIQDMSYVRATLEHIKDENLGSRIDSLEAECREHDRIIKSLEKRNSTLEEFTRNQLTESKKQMINVYISMGLAIFSAVLSFVSRLL